MRILLIHQNFPGRYKHLGPALVARGDDVYALTPKVQKPTMSKGSRSFLTWSIAAVPKTYILGLLILRQKLFEERLVMAQRWLLRKKVSRLTSYFPITVEAKAFSWKMSGLRHGWGSIVSFFIRPMIIKSDSIQSYRAKITKKMHFVCGCVIWTITFISGSLRRA